jgi:hypothetical protein
MDKFDYRYLILIKEIMITLFKNFRYYLRISKSDKKVLGRWNYVENGKQLERKIYLANHDNCGPCGHHYVSEESKNSKGST